MKKYALFIGRWQTWHAGHRWLIDQQLNKGKNVWLAVRDVEQDENNLRTAHQVVDNLKIELLDLLHTGKLFISIIPDIESVNYGRYVGYDVIYHEPPPEVGSISGTAIREGKIDQNGTSKETHS
jgi:hypothetical protein